MFIEQYRQAKIMIVDDQKLHYLYLKKTLLDAGYKNIMCVSEPLKVKLAVQDFLPDLMILDLMIPGLDGLGVAKKLRDDGKKFPILMLTAMGEASDRIVQARPAKARPSNAIQAPARSTSWR